MKSDPDLDPHPWITEAIFVVIGLFLLVLELKFASLGMGVFLYTGGFAFFLFATRNIVRRLNARTEARRRKRAAIYDAWLDLAALVRYEHIEMTDDVLRLSQILRNCACPLARRDQDVDLNSVEEFAAVCRQKKEEWHKT